jgi:carbon storage regulator
MPSATAWVLLCFAKPVTLTGQVPAYPPEAGRVATRVAVPLFNQRARDGAHCLEDRMLILSRKVHQEVLIGDGISITIVAIRGKQVRVGIKAPPNVPIRRDELQPLEVARVHEKNVVSKQG